MLQTAESDRKVQPAGSRLSADWFGNRCLETTSIMRAIRFLECAQYGHTQMLRTAADKKTKTRVLLRPSSTPLFKYTFPPEKVKMLTTSVSSLSVENRFALFLFGRAFLITVRIALRESFARKALGTS